MNHSCFILLTHTLKLLHRHRCDRTAWDSFPFGRVYGEIVAHRSDWLAWPGPRPLGYPGLFEFLEVCCEESHLQKALLYNFSHTVLST